ncbi:MAG TPA: Na(+)/H(+) antiporter subunit B [Spongiibacteraceae bacterium]|jgi:multicomponent Na+:H+ antiporter subunit B|nr:Na(+)/H(+) antiporter subunit B [Spongiibacteraceae bacterium]HUH38511.1 Na(+)/H(+) antiporter subunit B [Spongiibacteraceae bacterium]
MAIDKDPVLRVVTTFLVPLILLFALYVQFHGEYGPGGGFQAGVIFGSGFVLYALVYGVDHAERIVPALLLRLLAASGVLLYAGVGVATLLLGGNFLDYDVLAANPVTGQHIGIILIELGVLLTVASVVIMIFFAFVGGHS